MDTKLDSFFLGMFLGIILTVIVSFFGSERALKHIVKRGHFEQNNVVYAVTVYDALETPTESK